MTPSNHPKTAEYANDEDVHTMTSARSTSSSTTPDKKDATADGGDDFFLPDFCNVRMVFAVVVIAEMLAIVLTLAPLERASSRWEDLSIISLFIQWVALISSAVLCLARRWLRKLSDTAAATASYFLLLTTTSLVSEASYWTGHWLFLGQNLREGWHTQFLISNLGICSIVSAIVLRYFYIQHQYTRNLEAKSQARIQALQSRIRPHFLFNSLNTIASLTTTQPELAEEATIDLADLFRGTLANASYEVQLKEEWNLARRYLHIEKLRLGNRLQLEWAVDNVPMDALIPQLTIQPLVENAIYHGIENIPEGGTITIAGSIEGEGKRENQRITIHISNPVPEYTPPKERASNKMAQENIRMRLSAYYGNKGKLLAKKVDSTYEITLQFPYIVARK
jgi:two-component system sensor histidine kinase AlgZ